MKYIITTEEYAEIVKLRKKNTNKLIDKKLRVLELRYNKISYVEIGNMVGYTNIRICQLMKEFKEKGLEEYVRNKNGGNHRSLTIEQEIAILDRFTEKANNGQVVCVQDIKAEFDRIIGKDTGRGYIYMVLKRHIWRKVMPRSKHPKKASDEAIYASKKLTRN